MVNCEKCNSKTYTKRVGQHLGLYCEWCGWLRWIPQPWENFVMPIGKYAGKKLVEIKEVDKEYLRWCANTMQGSIARRAKEALESEPTLIKKILNKVGL